MVVLADRRAPREGVGGRGCHGVDEAELPVVELEAGAGGSLVDAAGDLTGGIAVAPGKRSGIHRPLVPAAGVGMHAVYKECPAGGLGIMGRAALVDGGPLRAARRRVGPGIPNTSTDGSPYCRVQQVEEHDEADQAQDQCVEC